MPPPSKQIIAGQTPTVGPVILAIETAGQCGSLALVSPGKCIAEYSLQSQITHSRRMLHGIDTLLTASGLAWPDINALAVSLGPGSFTGLRIGLSTIKGLAMATGKPLIGVPTLDGLASQLSTSSRLICPVIDARKKEVYTAFYRVDVNGRCLRSSDYLALIPEHLAAMIKEPVLLIGDGAKLYAKVLSDTLGALAVFPPSELFYARASAIGFLALDSYRNNLFLDPATAVPIYVRASEAELNFELAHKI